MTDEIITKLSRLKEWKVMNRTSMMRYKNTDKNVKEIGHELNVTTILGGSVRKEKDDIRVTAQLINVEDSFLLWSNIYERKYERIFSIQSDIAEKIAQALKAELSPEEKEGFEKTPAENLEAYNLYLKGRFFWNKRTGESLKRALGYFEKAIEVDPNYALGYVGLADAYFLLGFYRVSPPKETYPKAKKAALKALEIDEEIAEAHTSVGIVKMYDWDWVGAEKEFKQAIELNPSYVPAHDGYAMYLMWMAQHDEAIKEYKRALELDPFSPIINREVGVALLFAGQYDLAIEAFKKTIELEPNFFWVNQYLGWVYSLKSMFEEALVELKGDIFWEQVVYAKMGEKQKVKKWIDEEKDRFDSNDPVFKALLCGEIGETDQVFHWLEKAYLDHNSWLVFLQARPYLSKYKSDPRYTALLKKMGLKK